MLVQPEPEEKPKGKSVQREVLEAFVLEVLLPSIFITIAFVFDSPGFGIAAIACLAAGMSKARGDMHGELSKVYQSMHLLAITVQSQQNEIERLKRDDDA